MPDDIDPDQAYETFVKEMERQRRCVNRALVVVFVAFLVLSFVVVAWAEPVTAVYNPAVTQQTIAQTICVPGYTATVRPPYYISRLIKKRLLQAQGMAWDRARDFELDHIVPLCLGGDPGTLDRIGNLMLQPWPEARRKDRVEVVAMQCVCNGQVTLAEARADLGDWQTAYHKYARMICRRR